MLKLFQRFFRCPYWKNCPYYRKNDLVCNSAEHEVFCGYFRESEKRKWENKRKFNLWQKERKQI